MPAADRIKPLVGYPGWVTGLGVALLVVAVAALVWAWWWTRPTRARFGAVEPTPARLASYGWHGEPVDAARARQLGHVAQVARRFEAGQLDPRATHLELAAILRAFASARVARDVSTLTVAELRALVGDGPATATLYHYLAPSFDAPTAPAATTRQSIAAAFEVIRRW